MFVCCECCVLSGRGLCDGLITRPEESYRLWRVVVCDQETSKNEEAKARYRDMKIQTQWVVTPGKQTTTDLYVNAVRGRSHLHMTIRNISQKLSLSLVYVLIIFAVPTRVSVQCNNYIKHLIRIYTFFMARHP